MWFLLLLRLRHQLVLNQKKKPLMLLKLRLLLHLVLT
jgi:hypothetical protein